MRNSEALRLRKCSFRLQSGREPRESSENPQLAEVGNQFGRLEAFRVLITDPAILL
ncbi:MAG: hypothetical protein NXI22_22125 [bacterium]|nr:hypothetical protein [bacterium]